MQLNITPAGWLIVFLGALCVGLACALNIEIDRSAGMMPGNAPTFAKTAKQNESGKQPVKNEAKWKKDSTDSPSAITALTHLRQLVRIQKNQGFCITPAIRRDLREIMRDAGRSDQIRQLAASVLLEDSVLYAGGLEEMKDTLYSSPSLVGDCVVESLDHLFTSQELDRVLFGMHLVLERRLEMTKSDGAAIALRLKLETISKKLETRAKSLRL